MKYFWSVLWKNCNEIININEDCAGDSDCKVESEEDEYAIDEILVE